MSNVRTVLGSIPTAYQTSSTTNGTSIFTPSTTPLTAVSGTALLICQSNRFIDTSTNAFALTVNGSPSIQRFSPFSPPTAYSTSVIGGSGYFDGTGDYLNAASSSAFNVSTNSFCIEFWIYTSGFPTGGVAVGIVSASYNTNVHILGLNTTGFRFYVVGSFVDSTTAINLNAWNHVAFVRNGTTGTIYVNGVASGTGTLSGTGANSALYVGTSSHAVSETFTGYLSNVRFVNGSAVYTSNFTPPTAPLSAITNTSLLLSYTNAGIYDNAEMNDLETVGSAQVSTTQVKFGTGSMYFNGSGSYLVSNPASTQLYSYGGDFTIELWLYRNATGQTILFDSRPTGGGGASAYYVLYVSSGSVVLWNTSNTNRITGTTTLSNSTWYHIAVSRSGSSTKLFLNGTQEGSTYTDSTALICASRRPYVGVDANDGTSALNGYIDDLRVTNGYARYTTTFTPPTAAFPNQ
jgi:hypothetical protein